MEQIGSRRYVRQGGSDERREPHAKIDPIRSELSRLCDSLQRFNLMYPKQEKGGRRHLPPDLKKQRSAMVERIKDLRHLQSLG